ncbi:hypothetical protein BJF92_11335 [Rhizobium rhizosphaerae]|uniref:Uncharacterized protein n=1 Tax=Xaviernesmea rhizosphaerae TaxID=1672749 RepID=A0A1Q9AMQ7_9HYPH|nr:hypothetical protein [Xaviernesmea rhizosphaerae]OLP56674.1 hypothetical protein BJF92_11335 [Xaviernesmea rhizosphaerae]
MSVVYPYPVEALSDQLRIESILWDIQRNDEISGDGEGSVWQAELAPPLWVGTISLVPMDSGEARRIAARLRKLHGMQEALFFVDPSTEYPQADPEGLILGNATINIASVSSDRDAMSFSGFPAGYRLTEGDKLQISYGSDPVRFAFLEISEAGAANGVGTTPQLGVFPHVPVGVGAGLSARFAKPACRCVVMTGSHNPGTARKVVTEGAGFKLIEKR